MITVRAAEHCATCRSAPSEGTIGGQPVCRPCALLGGPRDMDVETANLVSALVAPGAEATVSMHVARRMLRTRVRDVVDYNHWATVLVDRLRRALPGLGITTTFAAHDVNGDVFAPAAYAVYMRSRHSSRSTDHEADELARTIRAYGYSDLRARALLVAALGPFGISDALHLPRLLGVGADLIGNWADLCIDDPLDETFAATAARMWRAVGGSGEPLRNVLAEYRVALAMPSLCGFREALQRNATALRDYLEQRYGRAAPCADATLVDPDAAAGFGLVLGATAVGATEAERAVTETARATGDTATGAAARLSGFLRRVIDTGDCALVRTELSDIAGDAALQTVDANLLRRAREALQRRTQDKQYSLVKLEGELLKLYSAQLRDGTDAAAQNAWFAGEIVRHAERQTIVRNATAEWPRFLIAAGNEFYRSPGGPPPRPVRAVETQRAFIIATPGEASGSIVADQLINMAAFFNKHALKADVQPPTTAEILTPDGIQRVTQTQQYLQIAADLQALRARVARRLYKVAKTRDGVAGVGDPLPGVVMVDETLLAIFDALWSKTVPGNSDDVRTFAQINAEYMAAAGSPSQRRAALLRRFLLGK
jgi:hypothetical protein